MSFFKLFFLGGKGGVVCSFVNLSVILILCSGIGTISLLRFSPVMASCSIGGSIFWCFPTPLLPFFGVQSQLVITRPFLLKGRSDSYSISPPIWYKNSFWYYLFSVKWRKPTSSSVLAICSFVRMIFLLPLLENQFLSMVTKLWNIWDSSSFWMASKSALAGARDEFPCCFVQRTCCFIAADAPSLSSAAAFWA